MLDIKMSINVLVAFAFDTSCQDHLQNASFIYNMHKMGVIKEFPIWENVQDKDELESLHWSLCNFITTRRH